MIDDIRRLRQRLDDTQLDDAARRQFVILIRAVMDGVASSPPQLTSDQHEEEDLPQMDLLASASAFLQQQEGSANDAGMLDAERHVNPGG